MIGIQSIGIVSAAGDDAPNTMASILSELQLFDDIDVKGSDGERLTGARTGLPRKLRGLKRLGGLGLVALTECGAKTPAGLRAPVLVCAPSLEDLGDRPAKLLDSITADASIQTDAKRSRVFPSGRAATGEALAHAVKLLRSGAAPACYLVGVDSLTDTMRARRLWAQRQLFEPANPDGFIPGEAGVCLLLTARADAASMTAICGVGAGRDDTDLFTSGRGLSEAVRSALGDSGLGAQTLRALIHDSSGARRYAEELALTCQRPPFNQALHAKLFSPADTTGEIGAASGPLSLAMAAFFAKEGVDGLDSGPILVACLSERTARTAVVVARQHEKRRP